MLGALNDIKQGFKADHSVDARPYIATVHFNIDICERYNDTLGSPEVRAAIENGDMIMCSAPWIWSPDQLGKFICDNKNPCGRVVPSTDVTMHFTKTRRSNRYFCTECASRV